ncbi:unnamed protein product, partial [Amoebophrya sp. A25]|eukprot:GSA25T00003041001.1
MRVDLPAGSEVGGGESSSSSSVLEGALREEIRLLGDTRDRLVRQCSALERRYVRAVRDFLTTFDVQERNIVPLPQEDAGVGQEERTAAEDKDTFSTKICTTKKTKVLSWGEAAEWFSDNHGLNLAYAGTTASTTGRDPLQQNADENDFDFSNFSSAFKNLCLTVLGSSED